MRTCAGGACAGTARASWSCGVCRLGRKPVRCRIERYKKHNGYTGCYAFVTVNPYYIPIYSLRGTGAVGPVQRRRAGARRRRARASAHGHFVGAQLGHVPSQQLQLLVALVVLLPQVLVLRFQVPQFVGHPFLDARRFGLDHFGVLEPQLPL